MRIEAQSAGEAKAEAMGLRQRPLTAASSATERHAAPQHFDLAKHDALQRMALQVLLVCSALMSVWLVMHAARALGEPVSTQWRVWLALFPLTLLILPLRDAHPLTNPQLTERLRHAGQALNATGVVLALQTVLALVGVPPLPWPMLGAILLLHLAFGAGLRMLVRKVASLSQPPLQVVVVGADGHGHAVAQSLRMRSEPTQVVGFVDDRRDRIDRSLLTAPFLGSTAQFVHQMSGVDAVVIAIPDDAIVRIQALANTVRNGQINVYLAPSAPILELKHLLLARGEGSLQDMVLLGMQGLPIVGRLAKRLFDIVFAAVALVAFLPFGLVIAALIKLESPGPVIYRQGRYGRGCRMFELYKFRSMRFDPVSPGGEIRLTQRVDARVTRLGSFLRRTSLDEFPQFINVLLGQMSVIGPRPHPPGVKAGDRIYEDVVADFLERYKVRPGITGWAQVNGLRGNTFTEDHLMRRFASDVEYIRSWSFELDLWIVLKTMWGGLGGKNAF